MQKPVHSPHLLCGFERTGFIDRVESKVSPLLRNYNPLTVAEINTALRKRGPVYLEHARVMEDAGYPKLNPNLIQEESFAITTTHQKQPDVIQNKTNDLVRREAELVQILPKTTKNFGWIPTTAPENLKDLHRRFQRRWVIDFLARAIKVWININHKASGEDNTPAIGRTDGDDLIPRNEPEITLNRFGRFRSPLSPAHGSRNQ